MVTFYFELTRKAERIETMDVGSLQSNGKGREETWERARLRGNT